MAKKYKMVVFDFDGTLVDSISAIANGIVLANQKIGIKPCSLETAKSVIGLGFEDMVQIVAPDLPSERYQEYIDIYVKYYREVDPHLELFKGVPELIQNLKDNSVKVAIATGKTRLGLDRITKRMGIDRWFDDTITSDEAKPKPDPLMLEKLMQRNRLKKEEVVMVGDSVHDVRLAHAAGVDCIAVTFGATPAGTLSALKPKAVVGSIPQLSMFLGV